ncbi:tetratricopeptide repeat protein [Lignipirellula cremea]|uniref:Tetratricopeptide repeat protein n=1 Tax=Lignipirellula cremea TaxID=2528010 RepID=A0A518DZ04_9BACT|nr:hypothetical protein [Lignipirellula cremea]QDU97073.1 hypothetical protein Pla8534_48990 [Lignipirellula cremea]
MRSMIHSSMLWLSAIVAALAFVGLAAPAGADDAPVKAQPVSFMGLQPGLSTVDEVRQKLGEPVNEETDQELRILTFHPSGFAQVQATILDEVAISILLELSSPQPAEKVVSDLLLTNFRPAPVPDSQGELLGQVYPERGVLMRFVKVGEDLKISHVVLEGISAEPYILRAQFDFHQRYDQNLKDLKEAENLDARDARIYSLRSRILSQVGRYSNALENAEKAAQLNPDQPSYELDRARLLFAAGDAETALQVTQAIASSPSATAEEQALAEFQLGEYHSRGAKRDYAAALKHHQQAVSLAMPLAGDDNFYTRRAAKQVLFEAHFAVARDICLGRWRAKHETAAKWIAVGARIGENLVTEERFDPIVRLKAYRYSLEAMTGLPTPPDPSSTVTGLMAEGERRLQEAPDELYRSQVQWELGSALFQAARIQRRREELKTAQDYLSKAAPLLESADAFREPSPERNYTFGCLYFLVGSIFAVDYEQHSDAAPWYDKAVLHFERPQGPFLKAEPGLHGERMVSMGVTFWETGAHRQALEYTQEGLAMMESAVGDGEIGEKALAVPYGNLASMHRQMGYDSEAQEFAQKAAHLEKQSTPETFQR